MLLALILIGVIAGAISGILGIGGGILVLYSIPGLIRRFRSLRSSKKTGRTTPEVKAEHA